MGLANEVEQAVIFELSRRFPGKSEEELEELAAKLHEEGKLKYLDELDTDGDGVVSKEEWEAPEEGSAEDLGTEIAEAAAAVAFHGYPAAGRHRHVAAEVHMASPSA